MPIFLRARQRRGFQNEILSKLYDATEKKFISQASVPSVTTIPPGIPDADKAKLVEISDAARKGGTTLITSFH